MEHRLTQENYYIGRGIAVWSGNHVRISKIVAHAAPSSGIRMNKADYGVIEDCHVYDNTWWTSSAESGIVFAEATAIDDLDISKLFILRNEVHDNINKIPYYNKNYEDPEYLEDKNMHSAREYYKMRKYT